MCFLGAKGRSQLPLQCQLYPAQAYAAGRDGGGAQGAAAAPDQATPPGREGEAGAPREASSYSPPDWAGVPTG